MLSMCSQRTRKWISALRVRRYDLSITIQFHKTAFVQVVNKSANECFRSHAKSFAVPMIHSVRLEKSTIPMCFGKQGTIDWMNLYFDDRIEGLKIIAEYLCSLFEKDVSDLFLSSSLSPTGPQEVMKWVNEHQKGFHKIFIQCENISDTVAEYLFENMHHGKIVLFNFKLTPKFKAHFNFDGDVLQLRQVFWFTLENLMSINCSKLIVKGSQLTIRDMNTFLKHWMSNDLKFGDVAIEIDALNLEVLFNEIAVIEQNDDVRRFYKTIDDRTFAVFGGFDIQRNDGMTATIVYNENLIETKAFWMIVWDNLCVVI
uniref:FBA_2 domain-containing protein n=1 Tax=Caenorhabditis tropicalis TaxID=1561998 RepID=A0A1I7UV34_9PELO